MCFTNQTLLMMRLQVVNLPPLLPLLPLPSFPLPPLHFVLTDAKEHLQNCEVLKMCVGASLSEPHTNVTALHTCVCIYQTIYLCLFGPTTYRKF